MTRHVGQLLTATVICHAILSYHITVCGPYNGLMNVIIVKNFHRSLTTVVRAQNDTSKTAHITDFQ